MRMGIESVAVGASAYPQSVVSITRMDKRDLEMDEKVDGKAWRDGDGMGVHGELAGDVF